MKRQNLIFTFIFSLGIISFLSVSCSKDDDPKLSKVIESIDIYQGTDKQQNYITKMKFLYDSGGRLSQMSMDSPLSEVNYGYPANNTITYSFSSSGVFVRVAATMEEGKARSCTFLGDKNESDVLYTYDKQYLDKSKGDGLTMTYEWKNGNLKSVTSSNRLFDSKYTSSSVANDYNLDLNVLPQLIDGRAGYTTAMNTFGQLIGVLGTKSKNIVEDTYYIYNYSYDEHLRLKEIVLRIKEPSSMIAADIYSFRISYSNK